MIYLNLRKSNANIRFPNYFLTDEDIEYQKNKNEYLMFLYRNIKSK